MAEVSNRPNVQQREFEPQRSQMPSQHTIPNISDADDEEEEEEEEGFRFDPLSPLNVSFFVPSSAHTLASDSDSGSDSDYPDYGDDQMNLVTDLFDSREERFGDSRGSVSESIFDNSNTDVDSRAFGGSDVFDSNYSDDVGLGLGSCFEFDSVAFALQSNESCSIGGVDFCQGGLRVARIDSDSDSEVDVDVVSGVRDEETNQVGDEDNPFFWDRLGFEDRRATNEELEWEEVDERIDDRECLSSVIDRIEEMFVSSEISADEEIGEIGDDDVRNLEWEILLAANNLERLSEFEHDSNGGAILAGHGGYVYAAEYDTLFEQFVQNESALKGSPPAAISVVENLLSVVLTKEEWEEENALCAVCKDVILEEEKGTRLPCCHIYHGDCIVPWLSIRNTCPVCRYELPTDDPDYEQRKAQGDGLGLLQDLPVRYNFELLP